MCVFLVPTRRVLPRHEAPIAVVATTSSHVTRHAISQTKYLINCSLVTSRFLSRSSAAKTNARRASAASPANRPSLLRPFFSNASIFGTRFTAFKNVLSLMTPRLSMSTMSNTPERYLTRIRYGSIFFFARESEDDGDDRDGDPERDGDDARDDPRDDPDPPYEEPPYEEPDSDHSLCSSEPEPASETAARANAARCFASAAFRRLRASTDSAAEVCFSCFSFAFCSCSFKRCFLVKSS